MGLTIGVDEVNYSPSLVGDCVVCALARTGPKVDGVKDSKLTTHEQRIELFKKIQLASAYSIVPATVNAIGDVGIYQARNMAIASSIQFLFWRLAKLGRAKDVCKVVIDGPFSAEWKDTFESFAGVTVQCLKDADALIYEVSAASIVAKVYIDALFVGFGKFYPEYRFQIDHGSPTYDHYRILRKIGPSPYHRTRHYAPEWWKNIMKKED
jgi:ribonuclease HII